MIKTWDELELPVLRTLADMEDQGASEIADAQVATAVGLAVERVRLALRRLVLADFVSVTEYREGTGGPPRYLDIHLLERGLRTAGAWPSI